MAWEEFERRVLAAVDAKLKARGKPAPEATHELTELLGMYGRDIAAALELVPRLCDGCGRPSPYIFGDPAFCGECRRGQEEAKLRKRIEAELRAELEQEAIRRAPF